VVNEELDQQELALKKMNEDLSNINRIIDTAPV
jgi:hypothetical protein